MTELERAGAQLRRARAALDTALGHAKDAGIRALAEGATEVAVARQLGVDRMTVRKWGGKQTQPIKRERNSGMTQPQLPDGATLTTATMAVDCPRCGALADMPCETPAGLVTKPHTDRVRRGERLLWSASHR